MENREFTAIQTATGQWKLHPQSYQKSDSAFFKILKNDRAIFMLADNQRFDNSTIAAAVARINYFYGQVKSECIEGYAESGQIYFQGYSRRFLRYNSMGISDSLHEMKKWLSHWEILDLSITLLKMIGLFKKRKIYFGGFKTSRIYYHPKSAKTLVVGGEFSSVQCSVRQYLKDIPQINQFTEADWKYQPPEIYSTDDSRLDYHSDLFVVACIIYELMTGQYPFETKEDLLNHRTPPTETASRFCQTLITLILQPADPKNRTQPQQLLELLQTERSTVIFSTNNNSIQKMGTNLMELTLLQNVQQFFIKRTKQTEAWFLYFCENSSDPPNYQYLENLLNKLAVKSEKMSKLMAMIEKYSKMNISKAGQGENFTYLVLKVGLVIFHILRKLNVQKQFHDKVQQIAQEVASKNSVNLYLLHLFKMLRYKSMLGLKYSVLRGNFHVSVRQFIEVDLLTLEYLCQYCCKLVVYIGKITEKKDESVGVEREALNLLCDELYDGISMLIYSVIALKADSKLGLNSHRNLGNIGNFENSLKALLIKISDLCEQSTQVNQHNLYSVMTDYYNSYQQQVCLIYQPVLTSYQYFYLDQNCYKGLKLPINYLAVYDKNPINSKQDEEIFQNRKYKFKDVSSHIVRQEKMKSQQSPNKQQNQFTAAKQKIKSAIESPSKVPTHKIKTEKQIEKQAMFQFEEFNFNSCQNPGSTYPTQQPLSSLEGSSVSVLMQELDLNNSSIYSYDWLKRTEKIMAAKKLFIKPELDAKIYLLYEQIIKGLKLKELIENIQKNKKVIVDPEEVLFQKVIGSGNAGEVYIGKYQQKVVAIKKVKTGSNPNALKEFQREVLTYIKIKSHECLVSLIGLTKFNEDYFLLTEFCDGGSLFELLHKKVNEVQLSWKERLHLALDIAEGMSILHQMNPPVIHRDLKSLNVFIAKGKRWKAKVADFGLSRSPDAGMMTSALGTLHWMAPELLCNKQYSVKVDVYSFGIVLWEICSRRTPYHNQTTPMAIVKHVVIEKGRPLLELVNGGCPQEFIELMRRCWDESDEKRPLFPQILQYLKAIKL